MNELPLLNESVVEESEIDSLGHMNVRYYLLRAAQANERVFKEAGLNEQLSPTQFFRKVDTYTQFRKEQFAGAKLQTYGGLVNSEGTVGLDGLRSYFEIRNPDTDALAATFIITTQIIDATSQQASPVPTISAEANSKYVVNIPKHGMPRSLSLQVPSPVTLEKLESVVSDDPTPGMGSGRRTAKVLAEDCDSNGRLREDLDLMYVMFRPQPGEDLENFGPPLMRDAQGRRFSWAMLETRSVVLDRPMEGDEIISVGADVAQGDKWRQSRRWMFVQKTGLLLGISDTLGICIDLDARRAISMPEDIKEAIAKASLPELI